MAKIVKPYFKDNKNVHIINSGVKKFLRTKDNFDLAVCMMNTFGNIDDLEIMKLIAKNSKNLIFTVYDKKYSKYRKKIYEDRGHKDFSFEGGDYFFNDCWIKGLKSKSYTEDELKSMCEEIGKKFRINKISTLLFLVHIYS